MTDGSDDPIALEAVRALLHAVGEDPNREGLRDTPRRVFRALRELTSGEREDVAQHLQVEFDGGTYDEIVALAGIPFTSTCEHHLLPFTGFAGVAYLPGQERETVPPHRVASNDGLVHPEGPRFRVVGLSKLARVVDVFARRLQLQERMTAQIAEALITHLQPRGVAVMVEAAHSCMACRGIKKTGAIMRTSVMKGVFKDSASARIEVLEMLRRDR